MSEVMLSCTHKAVFSPTPTVGDVLYCRRCGEYVHCLIAIAEWRIRCNHCRVSHRYGADEGSARRRAASHAARFTEHRVTVYREDEVMGEYIVMGPYLPSMIEPWDHIYQV